jgi:hypothetical protein
VKEEAWHLTMVVPRLTTITGSTKTIVNRIYDIHVKGNTHQTLQGKPAELQTLIKGVADWLRPAEST